MFAERRLACQPSNPLTEKRPARDANEIDICSQDITIAPVNIVMDSDCLIKLAKAGIKERICHIFRVFIPTAVRWETVECAPNAPDAEAIRNNIERGCLREDEHNARHEKGDSAVLEMYRRGGYDAIATDDRRFIRRLRALNVPFAVPAVLIVVANTRGDVRTDEAKTFLELLRPYISEEEYAAAILGLRSVP